MSSDGTLRKFKLSLYGSATEFSQLQSNLKALRLSFSEAGDFENALSILNKAVSKVLTENTDTTEQCFLPDEKCHTSDVDEDMFLSTESAMKLFNKICFQHNAKCRHLAVI